MAKGKWVFAAILSVGLGGLAAPASAAPPVGGDAGGLKAALAEMNAVEQARWVRRCWRDWRGRHCRRIWIGPHYGWGPGFHYHFRGPHRYHFRHGRHFRHHHYGHRRHR